MRRVCVEARKVEARHVRGIPRRFRCLAPRALCRRKEVACLVACLGGLTIAHEAGGLISAFYARFFATFGFRFCAAFLTLRPLMWPFMSPILSARLAIAGTMCRALLSPSLGALHADR
jgi:hypothetical protein